MILVPEPVIESGSPALEGRFLTTGPLGKSLFYVNYVGIFPHPHVYLTEIIKMNFLIGFYFSSLTWFIDNTVSQANNPQSNLALPPFEISTLSSIFLSVSGEHHLSFLALSHSLFLSDASLKLINSEVMPTSLHGSLYVVRFSYS